MPVKSGRPSGVFGAGAVKFGLRSGVRGVFGNGTSTHWVRRIAIAAAIEFIKAKGPSFAVDGPVIRIETDG